MSEGSKYAVARCLTGRYVRIAALAVLFTLATVCTFWHVLRVDPAKISGRYDVFRYYGPLSFFVDYSIHHGEFPLWNPLTYCGVPNAANPQAFLFYPPNFIRSCLNVSPTSYSTQAGWVVMMGLHLIFAAVCTYLLARAHRLSIGASLTAAAAFAFSALMVRRLCEYHLITTTGWLPLLLLLVKRALDEPRLRSKIFFAVGAGLALGVSILGGFLQVVNIMGVTVGAYAVLYRVLHPRNAGDPPGAAWWRLWLRDVVALSVLFILGVLVACVLLLPTAEYSMFTSRLKGVAVPLYSDLLRWTMLRFYEGFVLFAGTRYEAETLRGSGVAALLLAVAAFTQRSRWRDVALFAGIYVILFDCSLGPPLPIASIVSRLTPFSQSAYSRAYDFALLPLSLLAGLGVDAVTERLSALWSKLLRTAVIGLAAAATLIPLARWIGPGFYLPVSHMVLILPAVAAVAMIPGGWVRLPAAARIGLGVLMAGLVFTETFSWNRHYIPYMIKRQFSDPPPLRNRELAFPQDNNRDSDPIANRFLYSLRFAMNGVDPLHLATMREILSGPPRDRRYHRLVCDWEPTAESHRGNLFLKRSFWLARQWVRGPLPDKNTLFPAATTVFLEDADDLEVPEIARTSLSTESCSEATQKTPVTGAEVLYHHITAGRSFGKALAFELPMHVEGRKTGPSGTLHSTLYYHYKSTCPVTVKTHFTETSSGRAQWGKHARVPATGDREGVIRVPLPDFANVQAAVTVEMPRNGGSIQFTQIYVLSDDRDEDGLIQIRSRGANSADLDIGPLDGYRILTFLDAAYPGWQAYIDGKPVPILRANEVFKAVVVPPGTHHVRFAFCPKWVYVGGAISAASTLVACLVLWFLRPRRAASSDEPGLSAVVQTSRE